MKDITLPLTCLQLGILLSFVPIIVYLIGDRLDHNYLILSGISLLIIQGCTFLAIAIIWINDRVNFKCRCEK